MTIRGLNAFFRAFPPPKYKGTGPHRHSLSRNREVLAEVLRLRARGFTYDDIALRFGVSSSYARDLHLMASRRRPQNAIVRAERLKAAREIATHTVEQWFALVAEFDGRCVRCGCRGSKLQRDHILPLFMGGHDGIENIQPLCPPCNASKGAETLNWAQARRCLGFQE
jgi:hypothetical protein